MHMCQPYLILDQYIWNSGISCAYNQETLGETIFSLVTRCSSCTDASGLCSNPSANVTLTQQHHLLQSGQPYNIILDLEMPESDSNKQLGMFMIQLKLIGRNGQSISHSRRSAMLRYKSGALHFLSTIFFSPFLLTGPMEEKQTLKVEMFSEYLENPVICNW